MMIIIVVDVVDDVLVLGVVNVLVVVDVVVSFLSFIVKFLHLFQKLKRKRSLKNEMNLYELCCLQGFLTY